MLEDIKVHATAWRRVLSFFLLLFLVVIYLGGGAKGVQVMEFQKDGVATWWSVAEYKEKLDRNRMMDSVTLCGRFKLFFLHSRGTFFQLRDQPLDLHAQLKGELWLDRVRPVIAHRWNFQPLENKLRTYRWYHICFTYNHTDHKYHTYIDGELVYEMTYNVGRPIYGDYARLGQNEVLMQSYSGALSQVNVWDYPLTQDVVKEIAECRTDPQGNYVSWEAGWTLSNVTEYQVSLPHFCNSTEDRIYFWFPARPVDFAFYICEALGTHLPLPTTMEQIKFWFDLSAKTWPDSIYCRGDFWTPLIDIEEEGSWVTHYDNAPAPMPAWKDGEPNGIFYENCAKIEHNGVADYDCPTNIKCSVCEFQELQIFSFLGTCQVELRNINFIAYQEALGHLIFKGYGEYHIRKEGDEWLWVNVVKNTTIARLDPDAPMGMPMGRRVWHLETKVCDQMEGQRTLVLTPCQDNSYTCDDATCIPLENRCDLKYDCLDHSDEADCELITKPSNYKMDLPPRPSSKHESSTLPVALEIIIDSTAIETTKMTMKTTYEVRMKWFDNRLTFLNLKTNNSLNKVTHSSMITLWTPVVGFINTESHQHTIVDLETSLHLQQLVPSTQRDGGAPGEVVLYPGEDNRLILSRKYNTLFVCDFDLMLYPFDSQYCDMHLRMLSASSNYLEFNALETTAVYIGSKMLLEYHLAQPTLHYDNSGEFSEARVRIPLTRRSGYAILNIYTPSLILLVISYVSLFFRPHIFEVRVMTTLTALLVMATLFTQVSSSLPKTSYFKMVDVWLLFCIVISFMVIIFHAIIDNSLGDSIPGVVSDLPALTKVTPLSQSPSGPRSPKALRSYEKITTTTAGLITFARYTTLILFVLFNIIYWSYIFG
ncbi:uncharacterized protein LOC135113890 [Scylla paramamosain]|uniref:uncharacterized protein LOC135113890 n=1 Tax=Scylla paramamosain TaxID=85552 RepID=UPI0030832463